MLKWAARVVFGAVYAWQVDKALELERRAEGIERANVERFDGRDAAGFTDAELEDLIAGETLAALLRTQAAECWACVPNEHQQFFKEIVKGQKA
jgi:hypothetical protein